MGDGGGEIEDRFAKLNIGGTNLLVSASPAVSHIWLESVVLLLEFYIELESMALQLEPYIGDRLYCYIESYIE